MISRKCPLCVALLFALFQCASDLASADELVPDPICIIQTEANGENLLLTASLCGDGSRVLVQIRERTGGNDLIRVHDSATGKQILEKRLKNEALMECSISHDGKRVFLAHQSTAGGYIYRIEIIDLPSEKTVFAAQDSVAIQAAMSPDGNHIIRFTTNAAAEPMHQGEARVYRVSDRKEIFKTTYPEQYLVRLFSPDGKTLVLFGQLYFKSWDPVAGRPLADLETVKDISFDRWRFMDHGKKLRTIQGKELIDWDTQSGKIVNRLALRGQSFGQLTENPDVLLEDRGGSLAFVAITTGAEIARWNYAAMRSATLGSMQAGLAIVHGDRYRGEFYVVRVPDVKTLPPVQPIASATTKPSQGVPTTAPAISSPTKDEMHDPRWWAKAIEVELPLIAGDHHRSSVMYELSALHARLDDLDGALKFLEQANAMKQASTFRAESRSNEQLIAYHLAVRLVCEKRGVDAAKMLLDRVDEETRREADWMPESAICEGLARAGATATITPRLETLKGDELHRTASRVLRILGEKGDFEAAQKIALILPNTRLFASEISTLASSAARAGDFDFSFRMLAVIRESSVDDRGPVVGLLRVIGYQAQKQSRLEVLKRARELAGRDVNEVDWGVGWYFVQSRQLDAVRDFIKDRPKEDLIRRDFERWVNVTPSGESLEKLIDEATSTRRSEWVLLVQRLSSENRLDDIERLLADQRFISAPAQDRSRAAISALLVLYNADRIDHADRLYGSLLTGEAKSSEGLDYARAAAHRRRGNDLPYRELLEKIDHEAANPRNSPPEMRQIARLRLQTQVEDFDAAIRTSQQAPIPVAVRSLGSLILTKGSEEQIAAMMPVVEKLKGFELSNASHDFYTSLQKVGKLDRYFKAIQAMSYAENRCVFKFTAARMNLPVDPADQEYPPME